MKLVSLCVFYLFYYVTNLTKRKTKCVGEKKECGFFTWCCGDLSCQPPNYENGVTDTKKRCKKIKIANKVQESTLPENYIIRDFDECLKCNGGFMKISLKGTDTILICSGDQMKLVECPKNPAPKFINTQRDDGVWVYQSA
jgi:hypothetical protein